MSGLKQSGFGLLEVIIAAGVLGGLVLVGMQITTNQKKMIAETEFRSETNSITSEIRSILSDPDKCLATFGGKNALSATTGITAIGGGKFLSIDNSAAPSIGYGNSNIKIASFALAATASEVADNNSSLIINFQKKNILVTSGGSNIFAKKVNLHVQVDSANNVTQCQSLNSTTGPSVASRPPAATLGSTCAAIGSQSYNRETGAPMYCNGSVWVQVGGSGSTTVACGLVGSTKSIITNSPMRPRVTREGDCTYDQTTTYYVCSSNGSWQVSGSSTQSNLICGGI